MPEAGISIDDIFYNLGVCAGERRLEIKRRFGFDEDRSLSYPDDIYYSNRLQVEVHFFLNAFRKSLKNRRGINAEGSDSTGGKILLCCLQQRTTRFAYAGTEGLFQISIHVWMFFSEDVDEEYWAITIFTTVKYFHFANICIVFSEALFLISENDRLYLDEKKNLINFTALVQWRWNSTIL